jgi:translation initiation factor 2B subunit (eIF-2B alpha/beta/delta family)
MYPAAPDSTAIAQLHDQIRREASRLRRDAVNMFWCNAARLMVRLVRRLTHSTPTTTQKA